jgi:hypothetical protein
MEKMQKVLEAFQTQVWDPTLSPLEDYTLLDALLLARSFPFLSSISFSSYGGTLNFSALSIYPLFHYLISDTSCRWHCLFVSYCPAIPSTTHTPHHKLIVTNKYPFLSPHLFQSSFFYSACFVSAGVRDGQQGSRYSQEAERLAVL